MAPSGSQTLSHGKEARTHGFATLDFSRCAFIEPWKTYAPERCLSIAQEAEKDRSESPWHKPFQYRLGTPGRHTKWPSALAQAAQAQTGGGAPLEQADPTGHGDGFEPAVHLEP